MFLRIFTFGHISRPQTHTRDATTAHVRKTMTDTDENHAKNSLDIRKQEKNKVAHYRKKEDEQLFHKSLLVSLIYASFSPKLRFSVYFEVSV